MKGALSESKDITWSSASLFYFLCLNDMPVVMKFKLSLYADDSVLLVSVNNVRKIQNSNELENIRVSHR